MLLKSTPRSTLSLLSCTVAALLVSQADCRLQSIAIVRPFSLGDAVNLPESFDVWDTYAPCQHPTDFQVDLLLVFSQTLNTSSLAQSAMDQVQQRFVETNGWNHCFDRVVGFGVGLDPETDTYRSKEQDTNVMWVNGPNRQFERAIRHLQSSPWTDYELMYLMEMDSVPVQSFWLDALLREIRGQTSDFAIIGSKYRGDKWDSFISQMPSSLVSHINGNAIYNLTHPFLRLLVKELELEAKTVANSIPYDYRISQMIEEATTGVAPSFNPYPGTDPLPSKSEKLQSWSNMFDLNEVVREVSVFGNYANTNMVRAYMDDREFIMHGANMYSEWSDREIGNISLVVSDWKEGNSDTLLSVLDDSCHPFAEVVVVLPDNTPFPTTYATASTPIRFIYRGSSPDHQDICTAPVSTDWFMITDSFHRLRHNLQIMIKADEEISKPVVSYIKASHDSCFKYPSCVLELNSAKQFLSDPEDIFNNQDFVFNTVRRSEYCEIFETIFPNATTPPSATSYMAFLRNTSVAEEVYFTSDRANTGSRHAFLPLPDISLPLVMIEQRRLMEVANQTNETLSTDCGALASREECIAEDCEWRPQFESCRDINLVVSGATTTSERESIGDKPAWLTVLISVGIGCAALALITLMVMGTQKLIASSRSAGTGSLAPRAGDASEELEDAGPVSAGVVSELDGENILEDLLGEPDAFETIPLENSIVPAGNFEETDSGVEIAGHRMGL